MKNAILLIIGAGIGYYLATQMRPTSTTNTGGNGGQLPTADQCDKCKSVAVGKLPTKNVF